MPIWLVQRYILPDATVVDVTQTQYTDAKSEFTIVDKWSPMDKWRTWFLLRSNFWPWDEHGVMLLWVTHGLDILSNNYCSLLSAQTFQNSESLDNIHEELWLSHEMFAASHQCLDILSINPASVTLGLTVSEPTPPILVRDKFGTVARSASESCFLV